MIKLCIFTALFALFQCASAPTTDVPAASAPASDDFASAEALLGRLETAATGLRDFKAKVIYEKYDELTQSSEFRSGDIIYVVDPVDGAAGKRFAVLFDTLIVGDRKESDHQEHYIFADGWLTEIDAPRKNFVKRRIVPPGKTFDPLKLGEGPFPLPIGQPRAEVLARYDASLIPPPGDDAPDQLKRVLKDYPNVVGLRLKPKAGTKEAEDTDHIDVYYDKATLLPVGVNMMLTTGDRKTVRLSKTQRNTGITAEDAARLAVNDPDPAVWHVDIREW